MTRKITGTEPIRKHFDNRAERINTTAMPEARERLLTANEEERKQWLTELEMFGVVEYTAHGQDWTMRPHTENTAIYNIRKKSGLTRKQFAEKYHIPIRTLEKWERSEITPAEYLIEWLDLLVKANLCP